MIRRASTYLLWGSLIIATACSGRSAAPGDGGGGSGGSGTAGTTGGAGSSGAAGTGAAGSTGAAGATAVSDAGTPPAEHGIVMTTVNDRTSTYRDTVTGKVGAGGNDLDIAGMQADDAGKVGHVTLHLSGKVAPGTYPCMTDKVYISTMLFCCPFEYDSRNPGAFECAITLTEVGDDVAGTFAGVIMDENGGRIRISSGGFRVKVSN
jgi:hypothetical protein